MVLSFVATPKYQSCFGIAIGIQRFELRDDFMVIVVTQTSITIGSC